ncbi:Lin0512 family protein [Aestuariibius sp. HNIBRBA575]|uniref:Lin0512 family protein n=1 Tax=Aestuariibius sp. HNIBRBA575 TaxID=3233343 RepID=UPI0034A10F86
MTDQSTNHGRLIIAMGMGTCLLGRDNYTKSALHAIEDAHQHSKLSILKRLNIAPKDIRVKITVGVQQPDNVAASEFYSQLSDQPEIHVVKGGLNVTDPETGAPMIVASAAVEVFLPQQEGWTLR